VLRHRGCRVEDEAHATEEALAQSAIRAQGRNQEVVGAGHVEHDGWRDVGQDRERHHERTGHGAPAIDVQGPTLEQREVEVEIPAERAMPGQPIHEHGWLA